MKYPKLPDSHSGPGGAGVRALQLAGAEFQTRRGADYSAQVKQGFSRVTQDLGDTYSTYVEGATSSRRTVDYRRGFLPSGKAVGIYAGFGFIAGPKTESCSEEITKFTYGETNSRTTSFLRNVCTVRLIIGPAGWTTHLTNVVTYSDAGFIGSYGDYPRDHVADRPFAVHYVGRAKVDNALVVQAAYVYLKKGTRVDSLGRELLAPAVTVFGSDGSTASPDLPLPLPSDFSEYQPPVAAFSASHSYIISLGASPHVDYWNIKEGDSPWLEYVPLWYSADQGRTWTVKDIASSVTGPSYSVPPRPSPGTARHTYGVTKWGWTFTRLVMIGKGEAILMVTGWRSIFLPDRGLLGGGDLWGNGMRGIKISGANSNIVLDSWARVAVTLPHLGEKTRRTDMWCESLVYLGNDTIVGIRVEIHEFGGLRNTRGEYPAPQIAFFRSTDAGETWADLDVTGFAAPPEARYFGDLTVDQVKTDKAGGRLLITSWDTVKLAYYVFASNDGGSTWVKQGIVEKPKEFGKITTTTWFSRENGDDLTQHYKTLTYVGDGAKARPVDVALPKRYDRTAS